MKNYVKEIQMSKNLFLNTAIIFSIVLFFAKVDIAAMFIGMEKLASIQKTLFWIYLIPTGIIALYYISTSHVINKSGRGLPEEIIEKETKGLNKILTIDIWFIVMSIMLFM